MDENQTELVETLTKISAIMQEDQSGMTIEFANADKTNTLSIDGHMFEKILQSIVR